MDETKLTSGIQTNGGAESNTTASSSGASARETQQKTDNKADENAIETGFEKVLKKFFGSADKQAKQENKEQIDDKKDIINSKEQFDKMQKTLEEMQQQNAKLLNEQEKNKFVSELKNTFQVEEEDIKNSKDVNELKRKILAKETKQDFSKESNDYVNGVFEAIKISKKNNNANQQTSQIAQAVRNLNDKISPEYFAKEFVRTKVPQGEEMQKLKQKYKNVL